MKNLLCAPLPSLRVLAGLGLCFALLTTVVSMPIVLADSNSDDRASLTASHLENPALVEHFKQAFEDGFIIGPKRAQEAQKHLGQARRLAPKDARVDYALGLVLVRQSLLKQAITHFEEAIETDETYWPAWQAAIWAQFVDKRYEPGLKQLVEFARNVQQSAPPDEISEAQREAARWIGQVLVALSNADDSKRHDELVAAHVNEVLKALDDDLWVSLEEGRDAINEREFARGQAAGKTRQTSEKSDKIRKDRKVAQLDKTLDDAAKAKEDNEKSKEEWKTWLDDELAKSDKELGRMERDYKFLDQRAQSLNQSIALVGQELTAMNLTLSTINLRAANPLAMQNAQQQYLQRQNQMLTYQIDYNATIGRMSDVAQSGSVAANQRAAAITRYEKATGDLVKKSAGLDKWSDRLKNEKQKLTVNKPGAKGGKTGTDKKPASVSFKTILPLDLVHEKERVLASLSPPPKPVEAKGAAADQ
jgi:hypothetical protein